MREFPTVYVVIRHSFHWEDETMVTTSTAVAGFYHLSEAENFVKNSYQHDDYTIDKIQVK